MKRATVKDVVAVILAIGIATAVNIITLASLWVAVTGESDVNGGLSENATQLLTAAFSGIVGVLGGYIGFRAGDRHAREDERRRDE